MLLTLARALAIIGGALNLIATAAIFVMPMYEGVSVTVTSSGERFEQHFRKTLLEMQSLEPITILFFGAIILLSLLAAFIAIRATDGNQRTQLDADQRRSTRINQKTPGIAILVIGALLLFAAFISGFSVGAFYLPGAVMIFISGILVALR